MGRQIHSDRTRSGVLVRKKGGRTKEQESALNITEARLLKERTRMVERYRKRAYRERLKQEALRESLSNSLDSDDLPSLLKHVSGALTADGRTTKTVCAFFKDVATNITRSAKARRYDETMKAFAVNLRNWGGGRVYRLAKANLDFLPSLDVVDRLRRNRTIKLEAGVDEKVFENLGRFLGGRKVILSEDATAIVSSIDLNMAKRTLVGHVYDDGDPPLCITGKSYHEVQQDVHSKPWASNAYLYTVTPVDGGRQCYVASYPTDNRFTHDLIQRRWELIVPRLAKCGIEVLGHASDGDSRVMKCMWANSILSRSTSEHIMESAGIFSHRVVIFQANDSKPSDIFFQDYVHAALKLRNPLFSNTKLIVWGNYIASSAFFQDLLNSCSSNVDSLPSLPFSLSDVDPKDRQDFSACKRLSSIATRTLLATKVPMSEGLVASLEVVDAVASAFGHTTLSCLQRVELIFFAAIMLRIGKRFIEKGSSTIRKLKTNWYSRNCQQSVELSAHAMLFLFRQLHAAGMTVSPWSASSQACESRFRAYRSFSPVFSTQPNFTYSQFLSRASYTELDMQLSGDAVKPVVYRKCRSDDVPSPYTQPISTADCTDDALKNALDRAEARAKGLAEALGMKQSLNREWESFDYAHIVGVSDCSEPLSDSSDLGDSDSENDSCDIAQEVPESLDAASVSSDLLEVSEVDRSLLIDTPSGHKLHICRALADMVKNHRVKLSSDRLTRVKHKAPDQQDAALHRNAIEQVSTLQMRTPSTPDAGIQGQSLIFLSRGDVGAFAFDDGRGKSWYEFGKIMHIRDNSNRAFKGHGMLLDEEHSGFSVMLLFFEKDRKNNKLLRVAEGITDQNFYPVSSFLTKVTLIPGSQANSFSLSAVDVSLVSFLFAKS
eukprot:GILJ01003040.1.p1 GENE.GILJ01003040.1~~GILJ01003040.1.p1  ORF type:complete len:889 (-),score=60.84 GILJ01003040.1:190-2856(-)